MSRVGPADKNLPPDKGLYETPPYFYQRLHREFRFRLDAAASPENALCRHYLTEEDNALERSWTVKGKRVPVFCNPPYFSWLLGKFVKKAWEEWKLGSLVVMLLPASPDAGWYHDYVLFESSQIRWVRGRIDFFYQGVPIPGNRGLSMVVVFIPGLRGPVHMSIPAKPLPGEEA